MFGLLVLIALGAACFFIVPSIIPPNYRSAATATLARVVGVVFILFAVASTSFVFVPDGHVGHLFRVYGGGPLIGGRIIAANAENGPQAEIFTPGFHARFLLNVIYNVDTGKEEVNVPQGKVAILTARDGAPLRSGQAFADPFPTNLGYQMLDAATFIGNGGQRGPQLTVLTPGKWRINRYLWDVAEVDAKEVKAGYVGVVKSNVHADIDFGTLKATKPDTCDVIVNKDASAGRLDAPIVPVGCVGVWREALPPGKYYFPTDAFQITEIDTRAQVWSYAGGYKRSNITLTVDSKGDIIQNRTEENVPIDKDNADRAVFVKMEGWDVPLELRVVAQVSPSDASCVVAGVGTLRDIEDRVLTPSIRAITRDVAGGTYEVTEARVDENAKPILDREGKPIFVTVNRPTKVLDLINQRPLIESEIERRIRPEASKSCVTIREVRLGEPAIPPELLVAVRREQLATQLAKAFIQERAAQEKRIDSEKAKETANQQGTLVRAEIGVQASVQNALAARNEGQGERDKLTAIAAGQKAQVEVLGPDATRQLRQFELTLETLSKFANAHPEVLSAALSNAYKFVPQTSISLGGGGSGSLLDAAGLLGGLLTAGQAAPTQPQTAPPATSPARTTGGSPGRQ
jgi:SPFH domain / Band 7 family